MSNCSKCGIEQKIGSYSLISDMCDDCYEKEFYYKHENKYIKEYINEPLVITGRNLLFDIMDAESNLHDRIKKEAKKRNMVFACVYREYTISKNIKEI